MAEENKNYTMRALNYQVDKNLNLNDANYNSCTNDLVYRGDNIGNLSCWNYWERYYYPDVIRESYPIYIRERAEDKGKQAFEIIKILNDKRLTKIETVKDFIEAMDALLKIL